MNEQEMADACRDFVKAEEPFNKLNARREQPGFDVCPWFDLLEERYQCEKRVWTMFIQGDRSRRTGLMYLQFRETLMSGRSTRADA